MGYLFRKIIFLSLFISPLVYGAESSCPQGQYKVVAHWRSGYVRSDGTVVRATHVKAHCKTSTSDYDYLKSRFKTGAPPNWPHKTEKPGVWTESEKERLIEALEELPDLLKSSRLKGIYRFSKSKDYPNPATSADGILVLYDSIFEPDRPTGRIIGHELAHQHLVDQDDRERLDYSRATGWRTKVDPVSREIFWSGRKDGYVAEDGKNSLEEDYANNIEYYLYDPDTLKKVTPAAYDWIKRRYGKELKLKRQGK